MSLHASGTSESPPPLPPYDIHKKPALVDFIDDYARILIKAFGQEIAKKPGTYFLIMEVCKRYYRDDPVTIKEAYRAMQQEGPTAGARVQALEDAGYLIRSQHPRDKRKKVPYPTEKLRERFHAVTSEGIEAILRCLGSIQNDGDQDAVVTKPHADDKHGPLILSILGAGK